MWGYKNLEENYLTAKWIEPHNLEGKHFKNKGLQKYQTKAESREWCVLKEYISVTRKTSQKPCVNWSQPPWILHTLNLFCGIVSHGSLSCLPHNKDFWHGSEPHIEEPFSDLGVCRPANTCGQKLLLKKNAFVGKRNSCNKWSWLGHKNGYWKAQKRILKTDYKNLECLMKNLDILF